MARYRAAVDDDERALNDAVGRLQGLAAGSGLAVSVESRWRGSFVVEGLGVDDLWTEVFEPVRSRRFWRYKWTVRQTVAEAERAVQRFLIDRPDLEDFPR